MAKLKRLKGRLKIWNRDVFRNIYVEIDREIAELERIQRLVATDGDSDDLLEAEMSQASKLNCLLGRRQTMII